METQTTTNKKTSQEEFISLRDLIELFLGRWYWFVLSVAVCLGIAWIYLSSVSPVYLRSAVMLVKSEKQNTGAELSQMLEINGLSGGNSIENEIYILRSYQLLQEVVKRLNLDVSYTVPNRLRDEKLFGNLPFEVRFLDTYAGHTTFKVETEGEEKLYLSHLEINGEKIDFDNKISINDTLATPAGRILFFSDGDNMQKFRKKEVRVSRSDLEAATNAVLGRIQTSALEDKSTLVKIECRDINVARADAILDMILKVYNETIVEDKNRVASNTAAFIDERIGIISQELGDVEDKLTTFKKQHRIIDFKSNAETFLEEGSKAKEESAQLEAQLSVVEFVKNYVTDKAKRNELIPNVAGVGDTGVQSQIENYNQIMLQRNRLASNSGENNPVVQNMDKNLNAMRATIAGSIDNYMRTIRLRLNNARQVEHQVNQNIESVPQQEKYALDVMRQQSIKETLYTYLLQKREETAMQLAITEANIRVIEAPFGSRVPIAPKRMNFFLIAIVIGFIIPFSVFYIREMWNTGVRGRKDIESATTLPVLGEIPARRDENGDEDIVVSEKKNDRITEAFRLVRTNLNFMNKDARVLMFTSTMAGEGKSFVSRNFAAMLAMVGRKVILVDTDIRKRTQSKILGSKRSEGVSTYLSGGSTDIDALIVKGHIAGIDFLPAGSIPPNPAELLMNERLELMIEELKKRYDYIILDNLPALVVADAAIVNRVTDITIYVIRDGVLDRRYLPELETLHKEGKFRNMCVILNDVKDVGGRYGYGYGRGYGYGYGYYSEEGAQKHKYISSRKSFMGKILMRK